MCLFGTVERPGVFWDNKTDPNCRYSANKPYILTGNFLKYTPNTSNFSPYFGGARLIVNILLLEGSKWGPCIYQKRPQIPERPRNTGKTSEWFNTCLGEGLFDLIFKHVFIYEYIRIFG